MERSRGWQKFKSGMKRAYQRYDRMMEKQGFYVVLAICVLVIGLSAFYTFRLRSEEEEPVLTSGEAESADSSQAQTLSEAKELVTGGETVLAVPTEAPFSLSSRFRVSWIGRSAIRNRSFLLRLTRGRFTRGSTCRRNTEPLCPPVPGGRSSGSGRITNWGCAC